jgi:hypothetical protein
MVDDAIQMYNLIVTQFARQEFDSATLRHFIAPGVPQMSGGPAPEDLAFWFDNGTTITVRTKEPWLGVLWWPKPTGDDPVNELHMTPYAPCVPYEEFTARLNLGTAIETTQGHPLEDLKKIHLYQGLKIVVNQIVYSASNSPVGLVGEIGLYRIFS